uniref:MATH domain-containing protein n=1 Tax=Romanomermis culicivorax TaxID=13658 RepID=A0A915IGQ0_ROMCU
MELSYTKDKFNVVTKNMIASKWYNSFDKEPTRVGWKIAFHKNFYEPDRWALFLYRTVESFSLEKTTFDSTLTVSEIFGRTIVEKSFPNLKFYKTSRQYKTQRYFLRWFCRDEMNLLRNDKLALKINIRKLKTERENCETLVETEFSADQDIKHSLIFDDLFPKEGMSFSKFKAR